MEIASGPNSKYPKAMRFPRYVASGTYPRAVVGLSASDPGVLDPGSNDFRFGAVLKVDGVSSGRGDDNGDNVFQRGLSSDRAMFKLEVDGDRPACTVRGSSGKVVVRSPRRIGRSWYHAWCAKTGNRLSIYVRPMDQAGGLVSATGWGRMGQVSFAGATRASIGGKLTSSGAIVSGASDQFNGLISRVDAQLLD